MERTSHFPPQGARLVKSHSFVPPEASKMVPAPNTHRLSSVTLTDRRVQPPHIQTHTDLPDVTQRLYQASPVGCIIIVHLKWFSCAMQGRCVHKIHSYVSTNVPADYCHSAPGTLCSPKTKSAMDTCEAAAGNSPQQMQYFNLFELQRQPVSVALKEAVQPFSSEYAHTLLIQWILLFRHAPLIEYSLCFCLAYTCCARACAGKDGWNWSMAL